MAWLVEIAVCSRRCRHCRSRLGKFAYCDTFTSTAFRSSFAGVCRHCLISFSSPNVVLLTLLMSGDSMKHKGSEYVRTVYFLTIQVMPLQSTSYGVHTLEARGMIINGASG